MKIAVFSADEVGLKILEIFKQRNFFGITLILDEKDHFVMIAKKGE